MARVSYKPSATGHQTAAQIFAYQARLKKRGTALLHIYAPPTTSHKTALTSPPLSTAMSRLRTETPHAIFRTLSEVELWYPGALGRGIVGAYAADIEHDAWVMVAHTDDLLEQDRRARDWAWWRAFWDRVRLRPEPKPWWKGEFARWESELSFSDVE